MLQLVISASILHVKVIVQLLLSTLHVFDDGVFAIFTAGALLSGLAPLRRLIRAKVFDGSIVENVFLSCRSLPYVRQVVQSSKKKILCELDRSMRSNGITVDKIRELPKIGLDATEILNQATFRQEKDYADPFLSSRMTGTIYATEPTHRKVCNDTYCKFAHTNPLHGDAFPSVVRMESEIVNMAAAFLGGNDRLRICGTVTSGGTESILTALRASRDFVCYLRDIDQPEMIVATTAHAAVYKAAEYFKIKLVRVPVSKNGQIKLSAVSRAVNHRTVLIYASAPTYPHGVVDPIESLGIIAIKAKCCLHVDACLGGFVLPFISKNETVSLPKFDFTVPGVTSMSVDTHKYGFAQKGSSIVLYSSTVLRQFQYTSITDWTGGLYISPTPAGSRSGGLIAQTWASMLHVGRAGYMAAAKDIVVAVSQLRNDIERIEGLALIGEHVTMVVAWRSSDKQVNIYDVNDIMTSRGWRLAVLQNPSALHICVTKANISALEEMVRDLKSAVDSSRNLQRTIPGGKAPIYGLAHGLPDRGVVKELLKDIQDLMLENT